jgi:hypothetical protein
MDLPPFKPDKMRPHAQNYRLFSSFFSGVTIEPGKKYYLTQDRSIDRKRITGIQAVNVGYLSAVDSGSISYPNLGILEYPVTFITLVNHNNEKVIDRIPFDWFTYGNTPFPLPPNTNRYNRKYFNFQILTGECYFEVSQAYPITTFAVSFLIEYSDN